MKKWTVLWCCISLSLLAAACAPKGLVVLVPDPDGSVGKVTVSTAGGSVDLDQANQSTAIRSPDSAPGRPVSMDQAEVEKIFEPVLANQPLAPVHFILHFQSDSIELLPESAQSLPEVVEEIRRRAPSRVSVVGHTDTKGDKDYNLELSMRRAGEIKRRLIELGIAGASIDVSSHGEENPLVKTGDEVSNAENRRVEVVVR